MTTDQEIYDKLQKKKDQGEAMSGHEQMQLSYLTKIILLQEQLKIAKRFIAEAADKSNWSEAYYGEEYPNSFDQSDAEFTLKRLTELENK